MSSANIGGAAGDVYCALENSGSATIAQMKKMTGHKEPLIQQALGWLAREDKVVCDTSGRTARWSLCSLCEELQ